MTLLSTYIIVATSGLVFTWIGYKWGKKDAAKDI